MTRKNRQNFEKYIDIEIEYLKRDIDLIYLPYIRNLQRLREGLKSKPETTPKSQYFYHVRKTGGIS